MAFFTAMRSTRSSVAFVLIMAIATCIVLQSDATSASGSCGSPSNTDDCTALLALAASTNMKGWTKNSGWIDGSKKSVCDWHGVTCNKDGRVNTLSLKNNGLKGTIPDEIRLLSELKNLSLQGSRPADYMGCTGNDFGNSSLPAGFFKLSSLQWLDLEYTCLGGTLDGFGDLTSLTTLELHGNYIHGAIPQSLEGLVNIVTLKIGRNPITGQLPLFKTFKHAVQFNCNFCSLTGPFPDMFEYFPSLEITYWDGNGFTGSLPPSLAVAKKLQRVSFNINAFTGDIPAGICNIPAGDGGNTVDTKHDCRIGHDTNLTAYQANYPWIQKVSGNMYNCAGVPKCAMIGSCNKTVGVKVVNPLSPVRCV
eukprot:m.81570 g.81570  ORF g.81570 m.81570 type:complete len:364 (-) comp25435_c0_seq1:16-1107(-)